MAAGCGESSSHVIVSSPSLIRIVPSPEIPSNSGVVFVYNGQVDLRYFTAVLYVGYFTTADAALGNHEIGSHGYRAQVDDLGHAGGSALYWRPEEPPRLGSAAFQIKGYRYPYDRDYPIRIAQPNVINVVIVDPDHEPPRLMRHSVEDSVSSPDMVELNVHLHFSEPVLWGRMDAEYMLDGEGPYPLSLRLHAKENSALTVAVMRGERYEIALRNIYDLAENRGEDASVLIEYAHEASE